MNSYYIQIYKIYNLRNTDYTKLVHGLHIHGLHGIDLDYTENRTSYIYKSVNDNDIANL